MWLESGLGSGSVAYLRRLLAPPGFCLPEMFAVLRVPLPVPEPPRQPCPESRAVRSTAGSPDAPWCWPTQQLCFRGECAPVVPPALLCVLPPPRPCASTSSAPPLPLPTRGLNEFCTSNAPLAPSQSRHVVLCASPFSGGAWLQSKGTQRGRFGGSDLSSGRVGGWESWQG